MPRNPVRQANAIGRARDLRDDSTFPERLLWGRLRRDALGAHFRRQHPIGPFFADFCCAECGLVIEIDGLTHNGLVRHQEDAARTAFLEAQGFRVMRFTNDQVLKNLDGVVAMIRRQLAEWARDDSVPQRPGA